MTPVKIRDIVNELNARDEAQRVLLNAKIDSGSEYVAKKLARVIQSASTKDFQKTPQGIRLEGTMFSPKSVTITSGRVVEILRTKYKIYNISRVDIDMVVPRHYVEYYGCYTVLTCLIGPLVDCIHCMTHLSYSVDFAVEAGSDK